ncbi:MAG: tRNA pseudouridine(55) synthase TruB [Sandaracinaceae bacterium]|nr:tRNA pseudouridine(55) synthase TruB [Sandaracinaceae bacterium]
MHGVLVVDKPQGPTSHDVVRWVRRALRTRAVGHAGTLDPMATGVLVVAAGEATKLVRWLTADDKAYRATLRLGAETDTLDAEGEVVEEAPVPPLDLALVRAAVARFVGTHPQRPPLYSAIRVDGVRMHERARRGEDFEVPTRDVTAHRIEVLRAEGDELELELECSKGYYVRSLGRDLARALETRGHLTSLRRVRSGAFDLDGAVTAEELERAARDDDAHHAMVGRLRSLVDACGAMPQVVLDAEGVVDARHGRRVRAAELPEEGVEPVAMLDAAGELIAVGRSEHDHLRVLRGIVAPPRRETPNESSHEPGED